jgi:hypothetical protein
VLRTSSWVSTIRLQISSTTVSVPVLFESRLEVLFASLDVETGLGVGSAPPRCLNVLASVKAPDKSDASPTHRLARA